MKKGVQIILANVLKHIVPSKEEEREMHTRFKAIASKIRIPGTKTMLGGSGAKGTWLKDDYDMDVYVAFSPAKYKTRPEQLADILHRELKKKFKKVSRLHGSRDYFHLKHDRYTIEIVPILSITNARQAQNITDCSQLHVKYVQKHRKLTKDIRLAKAFAKGADVYGAESYIRGFSGYVIELLTIHYGSFLNLIKAAAKWNSTTIIGDKRKAGNLNYAKKQSPLILLDPVQEGRNAAAALSEEKYYDFVLAARAFLSNPSADFFMPKHVNLSHLEHHGDLVTVLVTPHHGKPDVVGAKIMKAFNYLQQEFAMHDFLLLSSGWIYKDPTQPSLFYFLIKRNDLPPTVKLRGPPTSNQPAVESFKEKHGKVVEEKGRLYAFEPRPYLRVEQLMPDVLKKEEVLDKVRAIQIIPHNTENLK